DQVGLQHGPVEQLADMREHPVGHHRPVLELYLSEELRDVRSSDRGDIKIFPARQDVNLEDALYLAPGPVVGWVFWEIVAQDAAMMLQDVIGDDAIEAPAISCLPRVLLGDSDLRSGRVVGLALCLLIDLRIDALSGQ